MCGISGLVNCGDRETLVRMTNVQTHRGPDDSGLWERQFPRWRIHWPRKPPSRHSRSLRRWPHAHEQRRWHGVDHLQRRDLQLRRSAPRTRSQGTSFSFAHRHRSRASSLRRVWSRPLQRLPESPEWHVCARHLRFARLFAEAVSGSRSFRNQAALLLGARRETGFCLRDQSAARSARHRSAA